MAASRSTSFPLSSSTPDARRRGRTWLTGMKTPPRSTARSAWPCAATVSAARVQIESGQAGRLLAAYRDGLNSLPADQDRQFKLIAAASLARGVRRGNTDQQAARIGEGPR